MKNPLDPRQFNPYSLNTPSGNLFFTQGVDFFNCFILNELSGDFNFSGDYLKFNGGQIVYSDITNNIGPNNTVVNSLNCFATGQFNTIVSSDDSEISGSNNLILGGTNNQVASADYSTVIGGRNVLMQHTGAVIIGDGNNSRQKSSVEHYSLTIDFASGFFVKNDLFVDGDSYLTGGNTILGGDLNVNSANSGLFSGDIQVLGTAYHTGSPLQNLQNLRDSSGSLESFTKLTSGINSTGIQNLSGNLDLRLKTTGSDLIIDIANASGALQTLLNNHIGETVTTTGNESIAGYKEFENGFYAKTSISGNNALFTGNFVLGEGRDIPSAYNSLGDSGQISWDTRYLYVCTGISSWARIPITGW